MKITQCGLLLILCLSACQPQEVGSPPQDAHRLQGGGSASRPVSDAGGVQRLQILSDSYLIDRKFGSMDGPSQTYQVSFPGDTDELIWLTAIRNEAVGPDAETRLSEEFLCHSNLLFGDDSQLRRQNQVFRATPPLGPRVFTLIQGQNSIDFPPGFGFPVLSGEPMHYLSMIVNNNLEDLPLELRVKTTLEYVRDSDLDSFTKPLFRRRIFTFVQTKGQGSHGDHGRNQHMGHHMGAAQEGEGVAEGSKASSIAGADPHGREYTFHWMVKPGRHTYRSRVRSQLQLPFDTTAHLVTAHLHPYGESVALRDLESGETLFHLEAKPYSDRIGIAEMEHYSSPAGVPFHRDREYELVVVYNNTTSQDLDAMAIMYLYFLDHHFRRNGDEIAETL